ncbi:MAG: FAD-dependent oxidoreductase, partial [Calditrichia bacterium]
MIHSGHFVAIFGSGVAGSEAAYQLARRGIYSVIFEQNVLPYGKIEEGLPKWHNKLRDKEEEKIDQRLSDPHIYFAPKVKLGLDYHLQDVLEWGFSAVLLAVGAWKDRSLPIQGIDDYIGRGLYYQNSFVSWFNHTHEPGYAGPKLEIRDGAIVIGGGLASLDVMKILMLETTLKALHEKGHQTDLFTLEREGIAAVLKGLGLTLSNLGLKGSTLYYSRKIEDMKLAPMPPDAAPERSEKVHRLRD